MLRKWEILFLGSIVGLFLSIAPKGYCVKKPTQAQKQEIQMFINVTNTSQKGYDNFKEKEKEARDAGNEYAANVWHNASQAFYNLTKSFGNLVVQKVDEYYGIEAPPGTTIEYDPDCKDYAYVPEPPDKKHIKVVICPPALSDGPGLVASTKIHELEHAQQVARCDSSRPGYWEDCTYYGHLAEREAYDAEERAYDACITSDMPLEEKLLIIRRRWGHHRAMQQVPNPLLVVPNAHGRAGQDVFVPLIVYNPSSTFHMVDLTIGNEHGWAVVPSSIMGIPLGPEEELETNIKVSIPSDAEVRTVNALSVLAATNPTSGTDVTMIYIPPDVTVTAGGDVMGMRGDTVEVQFNIRNDGPSPDTYNVHVTNPLGWATTFTSPTISLSPLTSVDVKAQVTIATDASSRTTNLVFCTATSVTSPTQTSEAWDQIIVKEYDMASLAIISPIGTLNNGEVFTPQVVVMNCGHIDSFFDVYFDIYLPGGGLHSSEKIIAPPVAPGQISTISFSPASLTAPGTYTAKAYVVIPNDTDSWNNMATGSFGVRPQTRVNGWKRYSEAIKK